VRQRQKRTGTDKQQDRVVKGKNNNNNNNLHILAHLCRVLKQGLQDLTEQKRHSEHMSRNRCLLEYATPPRGINTSTSLLQQCLFGNLS
jgi:hypothetical protein